MFKTPLLFLVLLLSPPLLASNALSNHLTNHPSPYLALHGNDPVAWQEWGPNVMARAKREGKLVFISSGYFACHWCHVMQRESYQNPEIAVLLNRHFIPVKVDRELLPALDAHLIDFVQRTRGHAGWPLNVFLTPEGYPLYGLTYSPADTFQKLLVKLEVTWSGHHQQLSDTARLASIELTSSAQSTAQEPILIDTRHLHAGLVTMALAMGNEMEGGFGNGNRFPMVPQWMALLDAQAREPDALLAGLLELTLDRMATQGMRDHLAGGFFRYTVDPGWQIPHYEKMLYNQALLARLYLQAAQVLNRPDYLQVARDTLDFTLKTLSGGDGGYIASLSAIDSQDVEGGGYLWRDDQLRTLLTDDEYVFAVKRWRLDGTPETEGGFLPVDHQSLESLAPLFKRAASELTALEQKVRDKLMADRLVRAHPRDGKQLAAWNGLLLSALVEAGGLLQEPRYLEAATALRGFLISQLWDGETLMRARGNSGPIGGAALEDYAYVATGLDDWDSLQNEKSETGKQVQLLIAQAWARFYRDPGWVNSDDTLIPGFLAESAIADGPMPSPAALLIELTLKRGSESQKNQARQALRRSYPETSHNPIAYATHARILINTP
ncbi:thioredoxin domain-containing protein [Sedimenticola selenatireducens]|uniref:Thioredoxin domain-containing protein n=1 Tax=Sedimenticola selenatireducens TaxID=191960 RepID=A0A557SLY1_9GAMM|nr:DUF255 domain-containing protein [Sedimenticola selenatireducens]TVO78431.1 thioredoxin domain-containing protein [Sedimenticola selenatireducens]TVT62711.1 MAG: thioredoxin domain-containing protein [Sedimenticola selenatireducens]